MAGAPRRGSQGTPNPPSTQPRRKLEIQPRVPKKGPLLPTREVEAFLIAYGDDDHPLPETVKVLDEIVTDYIIETCHEAAAVAHHARRAKIKLDDFKFMLRRDTTKLGRVSEMLERDKDLKRQRKAFDTDEGAVAKDAEEVKGDGEDGDGGRPSKKARSEAGSKLGGKSADGEGKKKRKNKKNKKGDGDEGSERG